MRNCEYCEADMSDYRPGRTVCSDCMAPGRVFGLGFEAGYKVGLEIRDNNAIVDDFIESIPGVKE